MSADKMEATATAEGKCLVEQENCSLAVGELQPQETTVT